MGACAKPKQVNHIPKEANVVIGLNGKSLIYKALDLKTVISNLFSEGDTSKMSKQQRELSGKVENSGIDFINTIYFFSTSKPGSSNNVLFAIFPLGSSSDFEKFVITLDPGLKVSENNDLKLVSKDKTMLAWNKNLAFWVSHQASLDPITDEQMIQELQNVANLSSENTLAKNNPHFKNLSELTFDVAAFMNLSGMEAVPGVAFLPNLAGNFLTGTLNFEKGMVTMDGHIYGSDTAKNFVPLMDKTLESKYLENIPSESPLALAALRVNKDGLKSYLKKSGKWDDYEVTMDMVGISMDEFFDMITGDINFSIDDVKGTSPQFFGEMGIKDSKILEKVTSSLSGAGWMKDNGNFKYIVLYPDLLFKPMPDKLVISNSVTLLQNVVKGTGPKLKKETSGLIKEGALSFYLDFDNFNRKVGILLNTPVRDGLTVFKDLVVTSVQKSGSEWEHKTLLRLNDKDQNSLITLIKAAGKSKGAFEYFNLSGLPAINGKVADTSSATPATPLP